MNLIPWQQEPSRVLSSGKQHPVFGRIWRSIGHAMLRSMHIHAGTHLAGHILLRRPVHDLLNREVDLAGLLVVKKRRCQKYLDSAGNVDQYTLRSHVWSSPLIGEIDAEYKYDTFSTDDNMFSKMNNY
jgi:hypothetical protein